ncbi:hypothetical protein QBC39DRAFT_337748 [Podospora conica]|nr:hypothetical protein QBC39DRAFT_337748 [Schizothecium conicum]
MLSSRQLPMTSFPASPRKRMPKNRQLEREVGVVTALLYHSGQGPDGSPESRLQLPKIEPQAQGTLYQASSAWSNQGSPALSINPVNFLSPPSISCSSPSTTTNHHLQQPLCIKQPRQDRPAAYATTSLRGLFPSPSRPFSLCRLLHGRREWPVDVNCRHRYLHGSSELPQHGALGLTRWLVSCCFLVFLAPARLFPSLVFENAPI